MKPRVLIIEDDPSIRPGSAGTARVGGMRGVQADSARLVSGCLGEEKFREELPTHMSKRIGAEHYGEERAETAERLAELIIAEELKRARWQEADLKTRPKGDSVKVALAARLRAETTMTVGRIAERLAMGTRVHLNHLLYRRRKLGGKWTISRPDPFTAQGWPAGSVS